ncbi:1,3-beta-glucan synthase subunit FKS1-like protein [Tanacetum coccineum]
MSKARKKAEKPEFMNQVTWEALCREWRLPTFIGKSERGKTARRSNKRLHTGGSIPINEHKTKLREELSREPSVSELFLRSSAPIRTRRTRCLSTQQQKQHGMSNSWIWNNLKNAQEAQSKKLDEVVKAQSSSEKRLRKYVAQEVGKVVANEVGKAVAEEVGKATQQILDAIRIRPV